MDAWGMTALLPCKADHASRQMALGVASTELSMLGCEAMGATFAIARMKPASGQTAADVMALWREAILRKLGTQTTQVVSQVTLAGAPGVAVTQLKASGHQPDGQPVTLQAIWLAQGVHAYQAVIFAQKITADMSEPFFSGLKFQ